jgi:hypothetical protein
LHVILSAHCAALVLQSTLPLPSQRGADSLQLLGRIGEGGLNPERYAGTPLLRIDDDPRGLTLPGGRRSDTGRQSSVKRDLTESKTRRRHLGGSPPPNSPRGTTPPRNCIHQPSGRASRSGGDATGHRHHFCKARDREISWISQSVENRID